MGVEVRERWEAKLVARLLATAALPVRIHSDISQKYKMGDISKGVGNTLKPAKKIAAEI